MFVFWTKDPKFKNLVENIFVDFYKLLAKKKKVKELTDAYLQLPILKFNKTNTFIHYIAESIANRKPLFVLTFDQYIALSNPQIKIISSEKIEEHIRDIISKVKPQVLGRSKTNQKFSIRVLSLKRKKKQLIEQGYWLEDFDKSSDYLNYIYFNYDVNLQEIIHILAKNIILYFFNMFYEDL